MNFEMIAILSACRIVEGRTAFASIGNQLKVAVANIVIGEYDRPDLIPVAYGGTMG